MAPDERADALVEHVRGVLEEALRPSHLSVFADDRVAAFSGETVVHVTVVAEAFAGLNKKQREALVRKALSARLGPKLPPLDLELLGPRDRARRQRNYWRESPPLSALALLIGIPIVVVSWIGLVVAGRVYLPDSAAEWRVEHLLLAVSGALGPVVPFLIAFLLLGTGRWAQNAGVHAGRVPRQILSDAATRRLLRSLENAESVTTKYCLYLRPFLLDQETTFIIPHGEFGELKLSVEGMLADALSDRLAVVSLGRGKGFNRPGTVDAGDEGWRSAFELLATHASLIVIVPILQPATRWEFQQLQQRALLSKTAFIIPPTYSINRGLGDPAVTGLAAIEQVFSELGLSTAPDLTWGCILRINSDGSTRQFQPFPQTVEGLRADLEKLYPLVF